MSKIRAHLHGIRVVAVVLAIVGSPFAAHLFDPELEAWVVGAMFCSPFILVLAALYRKAYYDNLTKQGNK